MKHASIINDKYTGRAPVLYKYRFFMLFKDTLYEMIAEFSLDQVRYQS